MGFLKHKLEAAKVKRAEKKITSDELKEISAAVVELKGLKERIAVLEDRIETLAGNGYVQRIQHALGNFCEVPLNRENAMEAEKALRAIDNHLKQQGVMNVAVREAVEYNLVNGVSDIDVLDFRDIQYERSAA